MVAISVETLRSFELAAVDFSTWVDQFDADHCTLLEVRSALGGLLGHFPQSFTSKVVRPSIRIFKPNEEWQRNQRKAARLPRNGYRSKTLPNDDGNGFTLSSLAYDIADFYELTTQFTTSAGVRYLNYLCWPYVDLRVRACRTALETATDVTVDPFQRLSIRGRMIRFVSWSNNASTHASEDAENVKGASTLCGGTKAFHRHTQQQWSCYACARCRAALEGRTYNDGLGLPRIAILDEES